jgi:type I thyroxine 5'-deiodinase
VVVYIQEIHPSDGWQVKENEKDAVLVRQHRSLEERVEVGETCMLKLALEMPAVVDEMDDAIARAYAAMPERLYLVGRDGRVAYRGGMGPMDFRPLEWEQAIEKLLADN